MMSRHGQPGSKAGASDGWMGQSGMRRGRTRDGRWVTLGIGTPVYTGGLGSKPAAFLTYVLDADGFAVRVLDYPPAEVLNSHRAKKPKNHRSLL